MSDDDKTPTRLRMWRGSSYLEVTHDPTDKNTKLSTRYGAFLNREESRELAAFLVTGEKLPQGGGVLVLTREEIEELLNLQVALDGVE